MILYTVKSLPNHDMVQTEVRFQLRGLMDGVRYVEQGLSRRRRGRRGWGDPGVFGRKDWRDEGSLDCWGKPSIA
jgi:hypothetical protein